jgi:hypothetical protein
VIVELIASFVLAQPTMERCDFDADGVRDVNVSRITD